MCGIILTLALLILYGGVDMQAQNYKSRQVRLPVDLYDGDTIPVIHLPNVYIYNPPEFKNRRQERFYWRTVRDIKKTLPIAREVRGIIIETYEYLLTIPEEKDREAHLAAVEKGMLEQYTPQMKKLTFNQGKMLIKLVDRECHSTAYEAMQAFIGPIRSGMWQAFAWMFGASLKKGYEPEGTDRLTERVVLMVEAGQL
jgi:hypothetical protein